MTHAEIKAIVDCPKCGARAGSPCVENGQDLGPIHPARAMAAETAGGWRGERRARPINAAGREKRLKARYDRRR